MPEVFTSADRDTQKIIIYDAYFKTVPGDESGLNDRPSVLIHEMAHLNGFEGDAELGDINSAEALRNFALLACGLVDENLLFEKIRAAEQDDDLQGAGGELPYRPDQPRAPKGQPNGGQWIEDNSSPNGGGVGILNNEKNESNPTPEDYNKINIDLEISYAKGRPNDVYGKNNITTSAYPEGDDREYGQSHAGAREKGSFRTREDSQGGVLKDPKPNPKEKTVFKGSISINRDERD